MVFNSSATVYGMNNISPLKEDALLIATNPYGRTRLIEKGVEEMCTDAWHWQ